MAVFSIGNLEEGDNRPPLVCAEIGTNHDGSIEKTKLMLDRITAAGAKLVKILVYSVDELIADKDRLTRWGSEGHQTEETVGKMFERLFSIA